MTSVAIAGCGAIGGIMGGFIWDKADTVLICKNPELVQAIRTHGLEVNGVRGKQKFTPRAYALFADQRDKFDIIFLTMKATTVVEAAKEAVNYLNPKGVIVTMQNGIVEDMVAEAIGKDKLIGGIVGFGGTMLSPGVVDMTSTGEFIVGELNNQISDRIKNIKYLLDFVSPTRITTNILGAEYSKLLINACITTMGAASGLYLGEMLKRRDFRKIFSEIFYEGVKVADAKGLTLEKVSGTPVRTFAPSDNMRQGKAFFEKLFKDTLIRIVGWKYRKLKSSSLQSLERGRKTEVDFINGIIIKFGKELGVDTPVNDKIVKIIHEIEEGVRKIGTENLEELLPLIPKY